MRTVRNSTVLSLVVAAIAAAALILTPTLAVPPGPPDGHPGVDNVNDHAAAQALDALAAATDRFMGGLVRAGVEGTALGLTADGEFAIMVYVADAGVGGFPANVQGVPVVVQVTGEIVALVDLCESDTTARCDRPVRIGVSTGHPNITAGTIGCRVTDNVNVFALSNNHIYANQNNANSIVNDGAGDSALQPGPFDGGLDTLFYRIGELFDFEPIVFSRRGRNEIDAAIALSSTLDLGIATPTGGYGAPNSVIVGAVLGQQVQKFGRTTELTTGEITGVNATVNVSYGPGKTAKFVKQIIIAPGGFSAGGDSGSLIVTNDVNRNPVGLLFAGSSTITIANRIDLVLDRFNVTIDGTAPSVCGDGIVDAGEECDDGNTDDCDACLTDCTVPPAAFCGDGCVDGGEQCDDGNIDDCDGCLTDCTVQPAAFCGDGCLDGGEECDDGNNVDGDGCRADCTLEVCGDGFLDAGEECDDGNNVGGDGCRADCTLEICGDGILDPGEECDDGNNVDGDGCSSDCLDEGGCLPADSACDPLDDQCCPGTTCTPLGKSGKAKCK